MRSPARAPVAARSSIGSAPNASSQAENSRRRRGVGGSSPFIGRLVFCLLAIRSTAKIWFFAPLSALPDYNGRMGHGPGKPLGGGTPADGGEPSTDLAADRFLGIPLFPLPNVVLFPRAVLPLHIFEERYKEMTADALSGDRLLAMALLRPGWAQNCYGKAAIEPVACVRHTLTRDP